MADFDERGYPIVLPPHPRNRSGLPSETGTSKIGTTAPASRTAVPPPSTANSPPAISTAETLRMELCCDEDDSSPSGQFISIYLPETMSGGFKNPLLNRASAEVSLVDKLVEKAKCPHPWRHPIQFIGWAISMSFGIVTLILALAILSAIPIVNFMVLGYLLEVEGRVARSGRFRDAFPLLPLAPRVGGIVLGIWIWLAPLRFIAWAAADARLIAPGSPADLGWQLALRIAMVIVTVHLCLSLARGGRLSCFFRPLKNLLWLRKQWKSGGYWNRAEQAVRDFLAQFPRTDYFWKGLKGWIGAALWLVIPTALFAAANKPNGGAAIVSIIGGILLSVVLAWVPFLQARFAAEGRMNAFKELRTIREMYRRAPLCWALAAIVTYAMSFPLFFATIVLPPQDALWLVTPIFIISIYPARVLTGWAYYQAAVRQTRAWFSLRFVTGLILMPVLMFYTFILFFTQFIGSSGKLVLFQHHALLLPVPF